MEAKASQADQLYKKSLSAANQMYDRVIKQQSWVLDGFKAVQDKVKTNLDTGNKLKASIETLAGKKASKPATLPAPPAPTPAAKPGPACG